MALFSSALALPLLLLASYLALPVHSDDAVESQLLNDINQYRSNLGVPLLTANPGATCLADKLVDRFENQPCNNITEAQTAPGFTPNFPDYPTMLADCHLNLANTTGGQVLVDCIPTTTDPAATAFENFTRSQEYQRYMNSSDYNSIGIASEDAWVVVVLGTRSSDGNFAQSEASAALSYFSSSMRIITMAAAAAAAVAVALVSLP